MRTKVILPKILRKEEITRKERLEGVFYLREPDIIPVNSHVMAQAIYDMGWSLANITIQTELDADKTAEANNSNATAFNKNQEAAT